MGAYLRVNRNECCDLNQRQKYLNVDDFRMQHVCQYAAKHNMQNKGEYESKECEQSDHMMQSLDIQRTNIIYPILWKKFTEFRMNATKVTFDCISDGLKSFLMRQIEEKDIMTNMRKWVISFDEIVNVYPNVTELRFLNEYRFDDHVLQRLIRHIQRKDNKLKKVSFLWFNYSGDDHQSLYQQNMNVRLLKPLKWKIKHRVNVKTGYKISISFEGS